MFFDGFIGLVEALGQLLGDALFFRIIGMKIGMVLANQSPPGLFYGGQVGTIGRFQTGVMLGQLMIDVALGGLMTRVLTMELFISCIRITFRFAGSPPGMLLMGRFHADPLSHLRSGYIE